MDDVKKPTLVDEEALRGKTADHDRPDVVWPPKGLIKTPADPTERPSDLS